MAADPAAATPPAPASKADAPPKSSFCFTDPGCRTEVRLGALCMLAAVFFWLWLGPPTSIKVAAVGAVLLLIGVPLQAIQARTSGRPGYPWKLAVIMTVFGAFMCNDLAFRNGIGEPVRLQEVAPMMLGSGLWMLLWLPLAWLGRRRRVEGCP